MQIHRTLTQTLIQLKDVLDALTIEQYKTPLPILNHASIGQHTRHVIEFFQTLISSYACGVVNYDERKRSHILETQLDHASDALSAIITAPPMDDKVILLIGCYQSGSRETTTVKTTYYREMIYNLEHAIHHMAMIRIAIQHTTSVIIPPHFGVAPATIHYQKTFSQHTNRQ